MKYLVHDSKCINLSDGLVIASLSGLALHVLYFKRSEHHMYGTRYLQLGTLVFVGAVFCLSYGCSFTFGTALEVSTMYTCALLGGLLTSLMTYRLLLHPLRRFPGPWWARVTSLWLPTQIRNADAHKKMLILHRKYGSFVRIGSSDLSISLPAGVEAVYGPGSPCRKASWYDEDWPRQSLHTTRNHDWHRQRRRTWSLAFSDKTLRSYEPRIRRYNEMFVDQMDKLAGNPVEISKWFKYYSFDVMGDLAFNKDFGMLATGKSHWAVSLLNEALELQGLKLPTWIFRMLLAVPGLAGNYWKFISYCDSQLDSRMKESVSLDVPDVMATLLAAAKHKPGQPLPPAEDLVLRSDSRTIIVAGSDTTAASLTHIFFYLAKDQFVLRTLQYELDALRNDASDGVVDSRKLHSASYLNAIINETLRLHPVVPSALPRKTPPEGIMVGDAFVPGAMIVWCPQYVISRDEANYVRAEQFVPERWSSSPELIKDASGYAPFSTGPYGCIGRPLALIQLRTLIASILTRFDVALAPGEDGTGLLERSRDQFTTVSADLLLVFKPRQTQECTRNV